MSDRIEHIRRMLQVSPDDVFLVYSLGMELASAGQFDQAVAQFHRCIELDRDYLPAYAECGRVLRSAGRLGEASRMLAAGVELAGRQGQSHARDFLQQQLDSLPKQ